MIVFVTQLLLMMAGDVERNPGPGEREGDVWIDGGEGGERGFTTSVSVLCNCLPPRLVSQASRIFPRAHAR